MPPPLKSSFQLPARFVPLFLFLAFLFLLFAVYLFVQSTSSRQGLQSLQKQQHILLDQKRILEGQVAQLQAEHSEKEALVRVAEKEMSLGEQQQLVANLQNAQQQQKKAQQKALAAALELNLRKSATAKDVEVLFEDKNLIVRFYEPALFDPGEISVSSSGRKLLAIVAQSLNRDFTNSPVRVEGNSDTTPVSGGLKSRFPSNWELSSFRAASVARSLQESFQVDSTRLTPVGKAGTAPLETNDTREGRAKNRRIDLVVSLEQSTGSAETPPAPSPTP